MKRAVFFLVIGIFVALVLQPNLVAKTPEQNIRVPQVREDNPITNDDVSSIPSKRSIKIGIDAGHGGEDLGYTGNNEIPEKDINLEIAKQVGKKLRAAGYEVIYTREDDQVAHSDEESENASRLANMKAQNVDVLLSFQASNSNDATMKGFTIFTRPDPLSETLADEIGKELVTINVSTFTGVDTDHYSNFSILADPEVKTLLIDLGYLSNVEDYDRLQDPAYQEKIGQAITNAFNQAIE